MLEWFSEGVMHLNVLDSVLLSLFSCLGCFIVCFLLFVFVASAFYFLYCFQFSVWSTVISEQRQRRACSNVCMLEKGIKRRVVLMHYLFVISCAHRNYLLLHLSTRICISLSLLFLQNMISSCQCLCAPLVSLCFGFLLDVYVWLLWVFVLLYVVYASSIYTMDKCMYD